MTENSTKITKKPATSVKENSSVKGSSKNKKRKKKRNNIGIICGTAAAAIIIVVGGGYFIGRAYYSNRFLSGTTVNGIDVGGKTFEQACDLLGVNDMPYELTVKTIDGTSVVFKTADFDYRLSGKDELQKIYDSVNRKHGSRDIYKIPPIALMRTSHLTLRSFRSLWRKQTGAMLNLPMQSLVLTRIRRPMLSPLRCRETR